MGIEVQPALPEKRLPAAPVAPARPPDFRSPVAGMRVTAAFVLLSRVLGFLRDISTAALFGLGGVMDAFALAFRIPNVFRRLFGEGALSAAFIPALARRLEHSRDSAWRLASLLLAVLAVVLTLLVLVGEGVCALVWFRAGADKADTRLLAGLTAVMLPYLLFICLAAQAAAALQTLGRFALPALAPTVLNLCWLGGVWLVAPVIGPDPQTQAYGLAVCVLIAGVLQLAIQVSALRRLGFRFRAGRHSGRRTDCRFATAQRSLRRTAEGSRVEGGGSRALDPGPSTLDELRGIFAGLVPIVLGLAVTQINTLLDSLLAWGLARPEGGSASFSLFGVRLAYPLESGAVASLYYGERMYQFPLGVFGVALGTVIYPLLARHAARGDLRALRSDLGLGIRLVLAVGIPASAGLVLLAAPLADLLLRHGALGELDAQRAARVIACYSLGVWAYCGLLVLTRAFYALGDRRTPVWVAACAVPLNLVLNLVLVWPLAEAGLAVSTALSASVQVVVLAWLLHHTHFAAARGRGVPRPTAEEGSEFRVQGSGDGEEPADRPNELAPDAWTDKNVRPTWDVGKTLMKSLAATALMSAACLLALAACPDGTGIAARSLRVAGPLVVGIGVYLAAARLLKLNEVRLFWSRGGGDDEGMRR